MAYLDTLNFKGTLYDLRDKQAAADIEALRAIFGQGGTSAWMLVQDTDSTCDTPEKAKAFYQAKQFTVFKRHKADQDYDALTAMTGAVIFDQKLDVDAEKATTIQAYTDSASGSEPVSARSYQIRYHDITPPASYSAGTPVATTLITPSRDMVVTKRNRSSLLGRAFAWVVTANSAGNSGAMIVLPDSLGYEQNVNGLKTFLKENPVSVYYKSANVASVDTVYIAVPADAMESGISTRIDTLAQTVATNKSEAETAVGTLTQTVEDNKDETDAALAEKVDKRPREFTIQIDDRNIALGCIANYNAQRIREVPVSVSETSIAYKKLIPLDLNETLQVSVPAVDDVTYVYRYIYYNSNGQARSQSNLSNIDPEVLSWPQATTRSDTAVGRYENGYVVVSFMALKTSTLVNGIPVEGTTEGVNVSQLIDHVTFTYSGTTGAFLTVEEDYADDSDIVTMNKPFVDAVLSSAVKGFTGRESGTNKTFKNKTQPISFLHFSDIHGDLVELKRMVKFYDYFRTVPGYDGQYTVGATKYYIDDMICTGDLVYQYYTDGFDYWGEVPGAERCLLAIGNHDIHPTEGGTALTQAQTYNMYFAPYIANWGLVSNNANTYTEGKTYYYKDYANRNFRLIVLNEMLTGTDNEEQLAWFTDTALGTTPANYTVAVAIHGFMRGVEKVDCNFTCLERSLSDSPSAAIGSSYVAAVNQFIVDGGHFSVWFFGHAHSDFIVRTTAYPDHPQYGICIDGLHRRMSSDDGDILRVNGTQSQDLANIMVIDTLSGVVKLIRVGANVDRFMRRKQLLCFNYTTGQIIAQS